MVHDDEPTRTVSYMGEQVLPSDPSPKGTYVCLSKRQQHNRPVHLTRRKSGSPGKAEGGWNGSSDHAPILSIAHGRMSRTPTPKYHFAQHLRGDKSHLEKAKEFYETKLPYITKRVINIVNRKELETLYEDFCETMLDP